MVPEGFDSGERETPRRKAVHLRDFLREGCFCSGERETPRRKAVASERFLRGVVFLAASVRLHGARPWHLRKISGGFF